MRKLRWWRAAHEVFGAVCSELVVTSCTRSGSMRIRATGDAIYRLKVSLRGIRPPIWRRFQVPADMTLRKLHDCLQEVMGWTDSHLHQFEAGGVIYGTPDADFGVATINETRARLEQVLRRPKDRLTYEYDFGDGWEHDVVLEGILPPAPAARYPIVEDGKRACPPEDCGGGWTLRIPVLPRDHCRSPAPGARGDAGMGRRPVRSRGVRGSRGQEDRSHAVGAAAVAVPARRIGCGIMC